MLDINFLNVNFLQATMNTILSMPPPVQAKQDTIDKLLPKYTKENQPKDLKYKIDNDNLLLLRTDSSNDIVQVNINKYNSLSVNITQDTTSLNQTVNRPGNTTITIKQSN